MAAASRGEATTLKGCNHAVIRAPPNTAPAVEPIAVANTHCHDEKVAAVESFCFGFLMFLTLPHDAFAVNSSAGQASGPVRCFQPPAGPPVLAADK